MTHSDNDELRWSQLMHSAQQGNEQCYAELLEELGDVIAAFLKSRFGSIDLIEDCVQECLISIHAARHTYDKKRLFRPWFFAIVRNRTIDLLRSQKSYKSAVKKSMAEYVELEGVANPIEDEIDKSMIFSMLAPAYRDVLRLTKIAGFSTAEAAKILNISESSVRVRIHRGIKETREILKIEQVEK